MNQVQFNVVMFPVWWYTVGVGIAWRWCMRRIGMRLHNTGLKLFARHLREPLYGDYTRSGIIISFFLRLILLGVKLAIVGFSIVVTFMVFFFYLVILPLAIIMIIYQLFPV